MSPSQNSVSLLNRSTLICKMTIASWKKTVIRINQFTFNVLLHSFLTIFCLFLQKVAFNLFEIVPTFPLCMIRGYNIFRSFFVSYFFFLLLSNIIRSDLPVFKQNENNNERKKNLSTKYLHQIRSKKCAFFSPSFHFEDSYL